MVNLRLYIITLLSRIVGGGKVTSFVEKTPPQVHLIIMREWPENNPLILRNLHNFPPGAFYSTPFTIRHKRVYREYFRQIFIAQSTIRHVDLHFQIQKKVFISFKLFWNKISSEMMSFNRSRNKKFSYAKPSRNVPCPTLTTVDSGIRTFGQSLYARTWSLLCIAQI